MAAFWYFINNNIIQWLALGLSAVNSVILIKDKQKEKVNLVISQCDDAYNFEFSHDGKNQYAFCRIKVINKSKTETSITKIDLVNSSGNSFSPCHLGYCTNPLKKDDELCLFKKDMTQYMRFNIDSENLLDNSRLESYGEIDGYLFFDDITPLSSEAESFKLKIETPTRSFTKNINFTKFPDEYMSFWDANRAAHAR